MNTAGCEERARTLDSLAREGVARRARRSRSEERPFTLRIRSRTSASRYLERPPFDNRHFQGESRCAPSPHSKARAVRARTLGSTSPGELGGAFHAARSALGSIVRVCSTRSRGPGGSRGSTSSKFAPQRGSRLRSGGEAAERALGGSPRRLAPAAGRPGAGTNRVESHRRALAVPLRRLNVAHVASRSEAEATSRRRRRNVDEIAAASQYRSVLFPYPSRSPASPLPLADLTSYSNRAPSRGATPLARTLSRAPYRESCRHQW